MKKIISTILLFLVLGIVKAHANLILFMAYAKPGDDVGYTTFLCMPFGINTAWLTCAGSGTVHCRTVEQALDECPGAAIVFYDPGAVYTNVSNIIDGFYSPLPVTTGSYTQTYYDTPIHSQVVTFTWAPATVAGQPGIRLQIDVD